MAERRPSSRAVIVVTLAIVVASFVGGSIYGEVRATRTHALTAEIAGNESPSIMHLAAARADLRDLQRLLSTHVLLASTGQKTVSEPLKQVRERLRADLEAYFALPYLPGERDLWRGIEKELIDVDVLAGRILEETRRRPLPGRPEAAHRRAPRRDRPGVGRHHRGHRAQRGPRRSRSRSRSRGSAGAGCSGSSGSTGSAPRSPSRSPCWRCGPCAARRRSCGGGRRSSRGSRGGWRTIC